MTDICFAILFLLSFQKVFELGVVDIANIILNPFVLRVTVDTVHKFTPSKNFVFFFLKTRITVESEVRVHKSNFRVQFLLQELTTLLALDKFIQKFVCSTS